LTARRQSRNDRTRRGLVGLMIGVIVVAIAASACRSAIGGKSAAVSRGSCAPHVVQPPRGTTDSYDRTILRLSPAMYLTMAHARARVEADLSGHHHTGRYFPGNSPSLAAALPNGDAAAQFNGISQFVQVASAEALSIPQTGGLTIEAWFRPGTLQFPRQAGSGYVYILGKGSPGRQEYALRMYSYANREKPPRPNRLSAYVFNLNGGEGTGAYFQDHVTVGAWIMAAFVVDAHRTTRWPHGYVAIYKNGRLRGQVGLEQYHVTPRASTAPFRIATRDLRSYFQGAIGKVAIFNSVIPAAAIRASYVTMVHR
jgi:hypothetical protein